MDLIFVGVAGVVFLLVLLAFGVPIAFAMAFTGVAGLWVIEGPAPTMAHAALVPWAHGRDFIFVTVGTPQKKNGEIDLSMIKIVTNDIGKLLSKNKKKPIILIKSTVIPGTMKDVILPILERNSKKKAGKDFGLISNPEFLQESTAIQNTIKPHLIVLGGYRLSLIHI